MNRHESDEMPQELTEVIRQLEAYADANAPSPRPEFTDQVMAAIRACPPPRRAWRARIATILPMLASDWRIMRSPIAPPPLRLRAAVVLSIAAILATGSVTAMAVGGRSALDAAPVFIEQIPHIFEPPPAVSPALLPVESPAATETPDATETEHPEATESDRSGDETASPEATDDSKDNEKTENGESDATPRPTASPTHRETERPHPSETPDHTSRPSPTPEPSAPPDNDGAGAPTQHPEETPESK